MNLIASTGAQFADFGPYAAAMGEDGVVCFQATLKQGGTGIFIGDGRKLVCIHQEPGWEHISHPDRNSKGEVCFYARKPDSRSGVFLLVKKQLRELGRGQFKEIGPLGPTINEAGIVAFRGWWESGESGVFSGRGVNVETEAMAQGEVLGFQGLPVINNQGGLVIRQDLSDGGANILYGIRPLRSELVNTRNKFASLGRFPVCNDAGEVVFVATMREGGEGIFKASLLEVLNPPCLSPPGFVSFRGALINNAGLLVFFARPAGGTLGIYRDNKRVLGLDDPLLGSQIIDFAPNAVSLNEQGQLALRVALKDGRGLILRID